MLNVSFKLSFVYIFKINFPGSTKQEHINNNLETLVFWNSLYFF